MNDIFEAVKELCLCAKAAAPALALTENKTRNRALSAMADALIAATDDILAANRRDLDNAAENGVPEVMIDRLRLTEARIAAIADAMREVTALPDPLAAREVLSDRTSVV